MALQRVVIALGYNDVYSIFFLLEDGCDKMVKNDG